MTRPTPSPLPPTVARLARLALEQREFVATRRDVARCDVALRECGTREQPDALTAGTAGTAKLTLLRHQRDAARSRATSSASDSVRKSAARREVT
ncbi:hypothetical protein ACO0M4_09005 [Streptomyces sp. RGM 3693]|uniref:hypothetical protein n=1 Tax=Streptomyces sp. RGM 3693 TaxID=3413284 RepID=UPI003D2D732C